MFTGAGAEGLVNPAHQMLAVQVAGIIRENLVAGPAHQTVDNDCQDDCHDPSVTPETGRAVPGGLSRDQALAILREIHGIGFLDMDVIWASPPL
jgi:arginase family enzyme